MDGNKTITETLQQQYTRSPFLSLSPALSDTNTQSVKHIIIQGCIRLEIPASPKIDANLSVSLGRARRGLLVRVEVEVVLGQRRVVNILSWRPVGIHHTVSAHTSSETEDEICIYRIVHSVNV